MLVMPTMPVKRHRKTKFSSFASCSGCRGVTERIANLVDIEHRTIRAVRLVMGAGRIAAIEALDRGEDVALPYALPGYVDAHIHIESSMLVPARFAPLAVVHGTVATVSDPHEIANVVGTAGVDFMIASGNQVPLKFYFGAPSCVPATPFESAGAEIDAEAIAQLLGRDEIIYLAEMMNYPGVLAGDPAVMAKIAHARRLGKPIDGHAPGLRGPEAAAYAAAGISTDHECVSLDEAVDKLDAGMKILIRQGSAAKNFDALFPLIDRYPGRVMFCSDDKHPDELLQGHIDQLVRIAVARGADLFHVLQAACLSPVRHYQLPVGTLRVGDPADFQLVNNLVDFRTRETFIDGAAVAKDGQAKFSGGDCPPINHFDCQPPRPQQLRVAADTAAATKSGVLNDDAGHDAGERVRVRVIEAIDGSLVTGQQLATLPVIDGAVVPDPIADILKLVVVNRYRPAPPAVAFITGFGLRRGAIASSVGHDSHNILAVGGDDRLLAEAIAAVAETRGGIVATAGDALHRLPLPIAGLMSERDGAAVAADYQRIDRFVKDGLGSPLLAPFTTLSFMALLVIPRLKLSDLGLFDCDTFCLL